MDNCLSKNAKKRFFCFFMVTVFFVSFLSVESGYAQEEKRPYADLSSFNEKFDLFLLMQANHSSKTNDKDLSRVLKSSGWQPATQLADILIGPRKSSTRWFKVPLRNSQDQVLLRWLEISPWYLQDVTVWQLSPGTLTIKNELQTGLNVPLSSRVVGNYKPIVPIELAPGEETLLVIRVEGSTRSIFTMHSWEPEYFLDQESSGYYYHIVLFSSVLTLFLVMIIQLDLRSFLLGLWMVVTLFLDAEKSGFFSFFVIINAFEYFSNLAPWLSEYLDRFLPYASVHFEHKGYVAWMLNDVIFISVSALLLGVWRKKNVMQIIEVLWASMLLLSFLPHFIESYYFQYVGVIFSFVCSIIWLVLCVKAFDVERTWQYHLLLLLFFWWVIYILTTVEFVVNATYYAPTPLSILLTKFVVVLAIMLIYTFQRQDRALALSAKLRNQEREQRFKLEQAVAERTNELHKAMNEARKANEAKTRFLGRVTHDLKSPLTSIQGYSQLLSAESGKAGEMSQVIFKSATHMHRLIDRLIDYARGVTDDKERVRDIYLHSFLVGVDHESRILAKLNSNAFVMDVDGSVPPVVLCDETFLHEVLINLIENALKYTHHGKVSLSVEGQVCDDKQSAMLVFNLIDNGCGIDNDMQQVMFEPFSRESDGKSGLGLGLSIAKELTERMQGKLDIKSERNHGTHVTFSLPVSLGKEDDSSAVLIKSPAHILPEVDAEGLTAWMIEDAEPIRKLMALELKSLGFDVLTFSSAGEVAAALQKDISQPDLVITDYWLGNELGGEVLSQIKTYAQATPVILMSATWNLLKEGLRSPELDDDEMFFSAFVTKPVNLINLRREIARVCNLNIYEPGQQPASMPTENPAVRFSVAEREKLDQWIELGAVTDILEWCEAFIPDDFEQKTLLEEIRDCANRGDFKSLKKLL
ncbi:ATP-binding protein [Vreelandella aquamarina]